MPTLNPSRQTSSSLDTTTKKLHRKITQHIKQIIRHTTTPTTLSQKPANRPQQIPSKIIERTKLTHKYLYKKNLINTKFEWLNKYLENSQLRAGKVGKVGGSSSNNRKEDKENKENKENQQQIDGEKREEARGSVKQHNVDSWKKTHCKRARTQAIESGQDVEQQRHKQQSEDDHNKQGSQRIFRERSLNRKILSQNHFRLKKSTSSKPKNPLSSSGVEDEHLRKMLMQQRLLNISNSKYLGNSSNQGRDSCCSYHNPTPLDKQNPTNLLPSDHPRKPPIKSIKAFIDQNTPVKQFLECTARMNSSNLMLKNKSGYIKNRKKQYIYESKESKRQQSELLKIKRRFEEEIVIEPWKLHGEGKEEEGEEGGFGVMRS